MVKASELFTNKEDRDILRKIVTMFHGKIVRITDMRTMVSGTVTGASKNPSKYSGHFYYMFFKCDDGEQRRSCLAPNMGNFDKWEGFIDRALDGETFRLDNLLVLKKGMIDADSNPREVKDADIRG